MIKSSEQSIGRFSWIGLVVGLIGTLIFFRSYLLAPGWNWLIADDFDSRLLTWIFEWGYHILFEKVNPLHFFQANSFFPHDNTLAFSDSLLSAQLFYAPFRLLGIPTIPALYCSLAAITIAAAIVSDRGLIRLQFTPIERAIIIWVSHFGLSITSFLGHYQLFGFQLAAPFLIYLYLYCRDLETRDAAILGILFAVGVLFAMYLAPMLMSVGLFAGLPVLLWKISSRWKNSQFIRQLLVGAGILGAIALVIYFIQLRVYFEIAKVLPKQSFDETAQYSARILSIVRGFSLSSFWYGPSGYGVNGDWERAYFPGFILLLAMVTFVVITVAQQIGGVKLLSDQTSPPTETAHDFPLSSDCTITFSTYCLLLFSAALVLSWGPYIGTDSSRPLPFRFLSEILPGLSSVRAPGRFGMLFGLPLAVFAVTLIRSWKMKPPRRRFIQSTLAVLVLIETLPTIRIFPVPFGNDDSYEQVKELIAEGEPVIELPVAGPGHLETLKLVMAQLNGSTHHWGKMVIGYGSRDTPEYRELIYLDQIMQQSGSGTEAFLAFCRKLKIKKLLIRKDLVATPAYVKVLASFKENQTDLILSGNTEQFTVYTFKPNE